MRSWVGGEARAAGRSADGIRRIQAIDLTKPTMARPGTDEKVLVLSDRYAAGLPLWHADDWQPRDGDADRQHRCICPPTAESEVASPNCPLSETAQGLVFCAGGVIMTTGRG